MGFYKPLFNFGYTPISWDRIYDKDAKFLPKWVRNFWGVKMANLYEKYNPSNWAELLGKDEDRWTPFVQWIFSWTILDALTTNKYNIFAFFGDKVEEKVVRKFDEDYVRPGEEDEAPSGFWMKLFGNAFQAYYTKYIWTYRPMYDKLYYKVSNGYEWAYQFVDLILEAFERLYGFVPGCVTAMLKVQLKVSKLLYIIPGWINFLILYLGRFFYLVGFKLLLMLIKAFSFLRAIRLWFKEKILDPIYKIVKPVILFIQKIQLFFKKIFFTILDLIAEAIIWVIEMIVKIMLFVIQLIAKIIDWFKDTFAAIMGLFFEVLVWIPNLFMEIYALIARFFLKIGDKICIFFVGIGEAIATIFVKLLPLAPYWQPAWGEAPLAQFMILEQNYFLKLENEIEFGPIDTGSSLEELSSSALEVSGSD